MDQVIPGRPRGVGAAAGGSHDVSFDRVYNEQYCSSILLSSDSITVIEGYGIVCMFPQGTDNVLVPD